MVAAESKNCRVVVVEFAWAHEMDEGPFKAGCLQLVVGGSQAEAGRGSAGLGRGVESL